MASITDEAAQTAIDKARAALIAASRLSNSAHNMGIDASAAAVRAGVAANEAINALLRETTWLKQEREEARAAMRELDEAVGGDPNAPVVQKVKDELDKLRRFKAFVHNRLDDARIPTHPNGPHSAEGCRIGDRLDIVLKDREAKTKGND